MKSLFQHQADVCVLFKDMFFSEHPSCFLLFCYLQLCVISGAFVSAILVIVIYSKMQNCATESV